MEADRTAQKIESRSDFMKTLNKNEMRKIDGGRLFKWGAYWYCTAGGCHYKTKSDLQMGWHMLWTGHRNLK